MSEVQAILEGTFSGVNLLIIGRLSKAGTDIGVCVMPGGIAVVGGKYGVLRRIAVYSGRGAASERLRRLII